MFIFLFLWLLKTVKGLNFINDNCEIEYPNQPDTRCVCVEENFKSFSAKMSQKSGLGKFLKAQKQLLTNKNFLDYIVLLAGISETIYHGNMDYYDNAIQFYHITTAGVFEMSCGQWGPEGPPKMAHGIRGGAFGGLLNDSIAIYCGGKLGGIDSGAVSNGNIHKPCGQYVRGRNDRNVSKNGKVYVVYR